ncbi:MAG: NAD(P)/FAD-dependent oxidoreductase [Gammaproteobacteria bacterium]
MYDLIIVGGGPAGLTAAVYALHKRLETLLVSADLGGKVNYRLRLKGFEGHEVISGAEVVEKFKRQLEYLQFAHRINRVIKIEAGQRYFAVLTQSGERYEARSIVIATGASPQRPDVPGEARLIGRGLSYSAISHAQLFIEKVAAVYGSSGRALRAAAELASVAERVHWLLPESGDIDSALGRKLRAHPKVRCYENAELLEICGTDYVESLRVRSGSATETIPVDGLFVALGLIPDAQFAADLGITDGSGRIVVDSRCATAHAGIFAAGDVTDVFVEQVLICIGEGAKAALSAYEYLLRAK